MPTIAVEPQRYTQQVGSPPDRIGIGAVVIGSLAIGLVAAVTLVVLPFAGARENVISGVVLLAFALGWALLALLSVRWTRQPQRWAAVPAGVFSLGGLGLLAWPGAVQHDEIGLIWPPLLFALVVWMTLRARRVLRSATRRWVLHPLFAILALAAVAGGYETVRERLDRRTFTMPGQLVDVGGRRLHLNCTGAGSPTVVLIPGLGETSSMWGWIAPAVARATRVCVYDRAGRAWSESEPAQQDGFALADDLHTLLERAQVSSPYVLAGHSIGGLGVLTFAARHPDQVAGVVLLDSTHPEMFTRLPSYPMFYRVIRRASALFPSLARIAVGRMAYRADFDSLPPRSRDEQRALWSTARIARSQRDEWAALPAVMGQAQTLRTLGDRPLIVVTAAREAQDGWVELQNDLASLSTNSVHRVLPEVTHTALTKNQGDARAAIDAIDDVVSAVRRGAPLVSH